MRRSSFALRWYWLLFAVCLCGLMGAGRVSAAETNLSLPEWKWKKSEEKKISKYEKKVEEEDGFYTLTFKKDDLVVRSDISARFTAEFALYMETFIDLFPKIFPVDPKGRVRVIMHCIAYSNQADYNANIPGGQGSRGLFFWAYQGGTFHKFHLQSYVSKPEEKEFCKFYLPVLQHEGAHALLQKFVGKDIIPVAFNEGVATYFEYWDMRQGKKENRKRRVERTWRWHVLAAAYPNEESTMPVLKDFLEMSTETWNAGGDSEKVILHYALAESFTDFLLSEAKGRTTFKKIMGNLYRGRPYLLEDKQYKRLEPKWHDHIHGLIESTRPKADVGDAGTSSTTEK